MSHDHHHHHATPTNLTRAFLIGISLNILFVIIEASAGFYINSLSLISDAGHNLSDVFSLILALAAIKIAQRQPNDAYTFGYAKSTTLVSLFNAILLLVAMGAIGWEAISRFGQNHALNGEYIALVSGIGILINGVTAFLFMKDKDRDINVKGAYLHMAADALVSLGVVISGIIIIYTGWHWVDSVMSLVVIGIIIFSTWDLLRESLRLSLDGVPSGINLAAVREYLSQIAGVQEVHDLHIWALSTTANSLTAHLVISPEQQKNLLPIVHHDLHHKFNISHVTIQLEEPGNANQCLQTHG
ncbi:MAG: cation transporter [Cytophagales bacterium CG18_big_fil_WC_8_21_14_2_50_42_9]|nr:MAG: cation transporter [Cytophagales bacterium CG18_big_fil_WC_8_21_14_2_50_42_9]